jgi:hypothetical protein
MKVVRDILNGGDPRYRLVDPDAVEDKWLVSPKFLGVKNETDMRVVSPQHRQEIPVYAVPREGKSEWDLGLTGDLADNLAGFNNFGSLLVPGNLVKFGVPLGVGTNRKSGLGQGFDLFEGHEWLLVAQEFGRLDAQYFAHLIDETFIGLLVSFQPAHEILVVAELEIKLSVDVSDGYLLFVQGESLHPFNAKRYFSPVV